MCFVNTEIVVSKHPKNVFVLLLKPKLMFHKVETSSSSSHKGRQKRLRLHWVSLHFGKTTRGLLYSWFHWWIKKSISKTLKIPKLTQETVIDDKNFLYYFLSLSMSFSSMNVIFIIHVRSMLIPIWSFIFIFNKVLFRSANVLWKIENADESIKVLAVFDQNENKQIWKIMKRALELYVCVAEWQVNRVRERKKVRSSCSLWYLNFVHVIFLFSPLGCCALRAHHFN